MSLCQGFSRVDEKVFKHFKCQEQAWNPRLRIFVNTKTGFLWYFNLSEYILSIKYGQFPNFTQTLVNNKKLYAIQCTMV